MINLGMDVCGGFIALIRYICSLDLRYYQVTYLGTYLCTYVYGIVV